MLREIKRFINGEISTKWLIKQGMIVGNNFHRGARCFIDPSHCFLISIGDNVTMSVNVTVLAHDSSTEKLLGYTKIGQVNIGDNVFIGANTTILPNVSIGNNVIIGAGSVVTSDIKSDCVVAGNPAKLLMTIEEYKSKNIDIMNISKVFGEEYTMRENVTDDRKIEMKEATKNIICYIK